MNPLSFDKAPSRVFTGSQWFVLVAALVAFATVLLPEPANALPVFARNYDVPCSSCHSAIPRRNEYGDAFAYNGYQWPGEGDEDTMQTGGDFVHMRGSGLTEGLLEKSLPLGLLVSMSATYLDDPTILEPLQTGNPSLKLVAGGKMGEKFSFYGNWSGGSNFNEIMLLYNRIFSTQALNLRVGKFEQSTTLFKSNQSLIAKFMHGSKAVTGHANTKGRIGAEFWGIFGERAEWALGAVRNDGSDSKTDGYYRIGYKLGGATLTGEEPDISLDEPSVLDDMSLHIAHWGYLGKVSDLEGYTTADIRRLGLDLKYSWREFGLLTGVALGLDQNREVNLQHTHLTGFGELSYAITSWMMALYMIQFHDASSSERVELQHDAGIAVLLQENIRATMKYSYSDDLIQNERLELQVLFGM